VQVVFDYDGNCGRGNLGLYDRLTHKNLSGDSGGTQQTQSCWAGSLSAAILQACLMAFFPARSMRNIVSVLWPEYGLRRA
jgi:hypothetical protein